MLRSKWRCSIRRRRAEPHAVLPFTPIDKRTAGFEELSRTMNLIHIRNVIAIVERGSLRSASRQLGIAQPALTRSVRDLEQELGAELFERARAGMTVTPIGELFYRRAKGIEAEIKRTLDEIEQIKGRDMGMVTVGLSTAAHLELLPKILGPFRRRFPTIRLKILEGLFPSFEADIRDGHIDLYYGPVKKDFTDPGLIVEALFQNPRIIIARSGHPLSGATSIVELAGAQWVTTPVMIDSTYEVNAMFTEAGLPPPHIAVEATSGLSIITAVLSSDLLAPMPGQWRKVIEATPFIEQIPIREATYAPRICAVRPARMPMTPAAEYLNDLILRAAPHVAAATAPPPP